MSRTNRIRIAAASLVAAGALAFGMAAEAGAAPQVPTVAAAKGCAHAAGRERALEKLEARIDGRASRLQAAEDKATSHGRARRAGRIAKRLEKLRGRRTKVQARLAKLEARCGAAASATSS